MKKLVPLASLVSQPSLLAQPRLSALSHPRSLSVCSNGWQREGWRNEQGEGGGASGPAKQRSACCPAHSRGLEHSSPDVPCALVSLEGTFSGCPQRGERRSGRSLGRVRAESSWA